MSPRFTSRSVALSTLPAIAAVNVILALAMVAQLFGLLEHADVQLWPLPAAGLAILITTLFLSRPGPNETPGTPNGDILIQYAYHDALTKLPNRLLLRDRLSVQLAAIRRSRISVAMLMIDLDEFKQINDALGHLAGDELLVQVAERISETCRDTDTVARLGGDEFAVIQAIEERDQASVLANRIIANLGRPFDLARGQVHIGCSIGITITQSPDARLEELIDEADFALYRSKKRGGNVLTIFDRSADAFNLAEKAFETELVRAMENGLPAPSYVRQVDQLGQLAGVETELVWEHPASGRLDLSVILAAIHDRRLAHALTDHCIQTTAEAWARLPTLQITFNMLPLLEPGRHLLSQLCSDEFNLLRRAGTCFLAVGMPELERLGLGAVALVEELESHGYGVTIDCGESSPATLRTIARLRPSRLRLSSNLVGQIGLSDQALLAAGDLCRLARSIGIPSIATGVATVEQSAILNELGCDLQQGSLWGAVAAPEEPAPAYFDRAAFG